MLSREQIWMQIAATANTLRQRNAMTRGKWEAYHEALMLIEPAPLVLVDAARPYGRIVHPTLGDPSTTAGALTSRGK